MCIIIFIWCIRSNAVVGEWCMVHTSCRSIRNIAVVHGTCIMSLVHSIGCRSGKNNGQFQHGVARQLALLAYPKFPSNLFMTRTLLLLYADAVHGGMEIRLPIPIFSCEAVSRGYCIILGRYRMRCQSPSNIEESRRCHLHGG